MKPGLSKIMLPLTVILALSCSNCRSKEFSPELSAEAEKVASAAQSELGLTSPQTNDLIEALLFCYEEQARIDKAGGSLSGEAESRNAVHREFMRMIRKKFPVEKATEIIAWYYNYINKSQE